MWSKNVFIFGTKYFKLDAEKWQLLNFLIGEEQMEIYLTRRSELRGKESQLGRVFIALVETRVFIDLYFYKLAESLDVFIMMWCFNKVICLVEEEELCFQSVLTFRVL